MSTIPTLSSLIPSPSPYIILIMQVAAVFLFIYMALKGAVYTLRIVNGNHKKDRDNAVREKAFQAQYTKEQKRKAYREWKASKGHVLSAKVKSLRH